MAFTNTNDYLIGRKPALLPAGCEVVAVRYAIDLAAADLDANDTGAVGILPAGCVPVGLIVDSDRIDTNATGTIAASVGLVNSDASDLSGTAWAAGIVAGRDGSSAVVALAPAAMRLAPADTDRRIGIKFTAAAATKAAGQVGLTLLYRAA